MAVPTSFEVHIYPRHDPVIATLFLGDLYADFPYEKWNLARIEQDSLTHLSAAASSQRPEELGHRESMGCFALHTEQPAEARLGDVLSAFATTYGFELKHFAQFTLFPQSGKVSSGHAIWHDRPLPSTMNLAKAWELDDDMRHNLSGGPDQTASESTPVIYLVLETKAAALARTVGDDIDISEATAHELRDAWSAYDSFWREHQYHQQDTLSGALARCKEITSSLSEQGSQQTTPMSAEESQLVETLAKKEREVRHAMAVVSGIGSSHLEAEIDHEIYVLRTEIEQIEAELKIFQKKRIMASLDILKELRQILALHIHHWNEWVMRANYDATLDPSNLQENSVEEEAEIALQQIKEKAASWKH